MKYDNTSVKLYDYSYDSPKVGNGVAYKDSKKVRGSTLCENCRGGAVTCDIGKCVRCGGRTSSGCYKICASCARSLKICQSCQKPLR